MFATAVQPMAPSDQFNQLLQLLGEYRKEASEERKDNQEARHALRGDVNAKIDGLSLEMKMLRSDLTGADKRVLVLETHRANEIESARRSEVEAKRTAGWVALLVSGAMGALSLLTDWFWKK